MHRFTQFLALVCFLGFTSALEAQQPQQLAHMVFFTLKDDTPENRQRLIAACEQHLSGHQGTVYFSAGSLADDLQREVNDQNFDVALHLVFADRKAHDQYQTHPRHLQFIKENQQRWSRVRVFDSNVRAVAAGSPRAARPIDKLLAVKINVNFDQASLRDAIAEIQKQFVHATKSRMPLEIKIVGSDLQSEGITQNQRVRKFSQRDANLSDVLTALVVQANPLISKSPSSRQQTLVWVAGPDDNSILITTRKAARDNSYALPKVFQMP